MKIPLPGEKSPGAVAVGAAGRWVGAGDGWAWGGRWVGGHGGGLQECCGGWWVVGRCGWTAAVGAVVEECDATMLHQGYKAGFTFDFPWLSPKYCGLL